MTVDSVDGGLAASVLGNLDLDRAVDLVQQLCRIPSVLGEEGPLAEFLASVMRKSEFEAVQLQPVLPDQASGAWRSTSGIRPAGPLWNGCWRPATS